ncbi:MAG TPA: DUF2059 domain-containing protein [Candidatus Acidoferrum sp.]|nr:DUF2059 domain-containing protein [Candidatus Acidoferrum sp.]
MKAVVALILIYVGTFFVAIQGASNSPVQAAQDATANAAQASPTKAIDPAKEADIRSLLELIGAKDMIQDAANNSVDQFKERISAAMPNNERAQTLANSFAASFQKDYDPDALLNQLVVIYDKHYTDEDIKGLLQFYGSPLGQKSAAEMPKISKEVQAAVRTVSNQAAREAWQQLRAENPGATQGTRPFAGRRRWQQGQTQTPSANSQQTQSDSSQP